MILKELAQIVGAFAGIMFMIGLVLLSIVITYILIMLTLDEIKCLIEVVKEKLVDKGEKE